MDDLIMWAKNNVVANMMPYLQFIKTPYGTIDLVMARTNKNPYDFLQKKEKEDEDEEEEPKDISCPMYNKETKECLIYDNRPLSCQTYPLEFDGQKYMVVDTEDCEGIGNGETTTRNIVSILNSIHGGTEGNWYINTNATYGSETWGAASSNNIHDAVSESMDTAKNIMAGADVDGVADGDWPAFGDDFATAFILYSDSSSASPVVDGVSFNYDGSVLNRQKYDYTVDMMSVDIIKVKAPSSGGPRNARVYVSK